MTLPNRVPQNTVGVAPSSLKVFFKGFRLAGTFMITSHGSLVE